MAERLDIMLVTGEYPPAIGGVGDYTRQLARALLQRGHWVSVASGVTGEQEPQPDEPTLIPSGDGWGWQALRRVLKISRELAPMLVHIQYQTGAYDMHPAIHLLPALLHRLSPRPQVVVTAHDLRLPYLFAKADWLRAGLTTWMLNAADAVIVTNQDDERRLLALAAADRTLFSPRAAIRVPVSLVPIGSNIAVQPPAGYQRENWRQQHGLAWNDVVVGYFGLLSRTKGVLELVEALAALPPRFKLVIIGGAAMLPDDQRYAAEVQAAVAVYNLAERLVLTGPLAEQQVSAWLLAADLVALPFLDGAGYRRGSLLAALAHGVPVVTTTPAQPLSPSLVDNQHALLVPPAQPVALRQAIECAAADQALRQRLAAGGAELAAQFSWPMIAARHEALYQQLVKAAAAGAQQPSPINQRADRDQ